MMGDRHLGWGIVQTLALHSFKGQSPIWFYNLDYRGQISVADLLGGPEKLDFDFGKNIPQKFY